METVLIVLVVLLLVGNAVILFYLFSQPKAQGGEGVTALNDRIAELSRTMHERLDRSSTAIQDSVTRQLSESMKIVRDVTTGLTKLEESNKQVVSFADQLQNLQDILKNPKQRGITFCNTVSR